MTPGHRGRLVTASFVRDRLAELPGAEQMPAAVVRRLEAWSQRYEDLLGPASSVRAIADIALIPLLDILGLTVRARHDRPAACRLYLNTGTLAAATALAVAWDEPLSRSWRSAVREAIGTDGRWCFCCNGTALRLVDGHRTWSREYLEFELARLASDADARNTLWALGRGNALAGDRPLLDRAIELSAQHAVEVCRALGGGVLDALRLLVGALSQRAETRQPARLLFDHSLTVLYRILFLLFAEARGLVPVWHPVYRDRYSLDVIVATLLAGRPPRGLWQAIQAISRLAHAGCSAGELKVTAFNGRLFSPAHAATFERLRLDDHVMSQAVIAVSSTSASLHRGRPGHRHAPAAGDPEPDVRRRIVYRDLDVEQLGSVYEQVLEYEPAPDAAPALLTRTRDRRKASGTFYTPRSVTASLVHRTLEPLVRGRAADDILGLRVLDPAMGSGAFLVAACRYLAAAAEDALMAEGRWHPGDVTPADRMALRRDIASRCLFGVDLNPTAVQLARLSLWLATLAADKPLSFLDHRLVAGNSLIGTTPGDLVRQPSRQRRRTRRPEALPLFAGDDLPAALEEAARIRRALTMQADDTPAIVRNKEQTLAALQRGDTPLNRWGRLLDLWCAGWFWPDDTPPDRGTFQELCAHLLRGRSSLASHVAAPLLARAEAAARRHRFLHWPLAFPEVFPGESREPDARAGFDAIIGNPPWDMVRGDGEHDQRQSRKREARHLTDFVRESGVYVVGGDAHVNLYQLFLERALQLLRPGGRLGFVLPAGVATDTGAAPLRRHLFNRAEVDALVGLDNRHGVFPIHRGVRFALLTCSIGRPTAAIACRFGVSRPEDLDEAASHGPLILTRRLIARLSGEDDMGIPELASTTDLAIVEKISARCPWLGATDGWHVRFGRELNATDDRGAFVPRQGDASASPVVEGKQIGPFRVALDACRLQLAPGSSVGRAFAQRPRLAYRDVASATNRLTLIAAVVPSGAVTTHTLFCLKTPLPAPAQDVLCALLNSFVANYLVRLRVNTHVTVALVSRLPVPAVRAGDEAFGRLTRLASTLSAGSGPAEAMPAYAELQAIVARLYGLNASEFAHVVQTFPLMEAEIRADVLARFDRLR